MNKTQILIVEDEGLVAKDLQAMLRRLGYNVPTTVGTGELAIQKALENQPDLILMDIQLRGSMDGVQAAAAITSQQDVPIVYLTANSDEATLQRAKATGPFGFLVKPFEERAIQAGLEMALYKHATEKRIRERERWLSTTLGSIADAVITTDPTGTVTFLNGAAENLSGWTQADAVGRSYGQVFRTCDEAAGGPPADGVAAALTGSNRESTEKQTLFVRCDGSQTHIEHSIAPIRQQPDGQIDGGVIVFRDISNRMQLEEQLRQAQKLDAIGKLAGGIAHDFNNAITVIMGYAEIILNRVNQEDHLYQDAKQILHAAEHSARLTHQLLAFSRKQVLQPKCLNLGEELVGVEGFVRRAIGENIKLVRNVADDLWFTMADPGHFQQLVINMAINARDAMPQGGWLTLGLSNAVITEADASEITEGRPGEFVLLTISDTGTGMTAETMGKIFEPFFTTKGPGKGTGLGLATCYGIVRQSSGMIRVSSEPGEGTTFSIYLPKAKVNPTVAVEEHIFESLPRGTETILVVEDEGILRELAVQVLESLGYRVISAEDGFAAVTALSGRNDRVDLVVTDIIMPGMSGPELAAWIRENRGEIPVLFTSGYTDDEIIRSAIGSMNATYLQKPFPPQVLARKIREILEGANGHRAAA